MTKASAPILVTVLMSAYNAQETIGMAIESILEQTYRNFEFVIINDGSTDKTAEIIEAYADSDSRIKFISQDNVGLTRSLNFGLNLAKGEYIARQDADDYSYPDRLTEQVNILNEDKRILICGSNCDNYCQGAEVTQWGFQTESQIKKTIYLKTPFPHSTVMFRKDEAKLLGGYDTSFLTSQDMEFWMRLSKNGRVVMIEKPLIRRNILHTSISVKKRWRQTYDAFRARWRHNNNKILVIYHTMRSLIISYLPQKLIAFRKGLKR